LRGDCGYGNEVLLKEAERRGLPCLFKLRHTDKVKTLVSQMQRAGAAWEDSGHDFALQGYGIPDLITFAWSTQKNQSPALSLEALRQKLQRQQFTAFELKLRDWRKSLVQAYRYRYFCDLSIVVLPSDVAPRASQRLELFASLDVGLWSFDPDTD
jgi:hypothetical protein